MATISLKELDSKINNLDFTIPDGTVTLQKLDTNLKTQINQITAIDTDLSTFKTTTATQLGTKVDKVVGKQLSTEDYTSTEKTKLAGIATNANNYTHPATHPATMIAEDASNRFVTDTEKTTWNNKVNNTDYTKIVPYVVAAGTANVYTATLSPTPSLVAGLALSININIANTGASTLNVNGLGAKSILKSNGNALTSGNLKVGSIYTLRYNGTAFILQGEGGEYGTALASDVLSGKTIGTDAGVIQGTMPSNGSQTTTLSISSSAKPSKSVPLGYTPGGTITAEVASSQAANIKSGVTLGGTAGTFTSDATVVAGNILTGKTAYANGAKITGNMINNSNNIETSTLAANTDIYSINNSSNGIDGYIGFKSPLTGYVDSTTNVRSYVKNMRTENIKAGVKVGNDTTYITGTFTSDATATASQIRSGQTAYVNGNKVTGTLAVQATGTQTITPGTANITKAAGIYDGAITISGDADLVSANIKSGKSIFGVTGSSNVVDTSAGTATAGDILSSKIAFVDGSQLTGTMPNNGAVVLTPGTTNKAITMGYHSGTGYVKGDSNLTANNIKSGVNIFGVAGAYTSNIKYYNFNVGGCKDGVTHTISGLSFEPKMVIFESEEGAYALSNSSTYEGTSYHLSGIFKDISLSSSSYNGFYIKDIGTGVKWYFNTPTWGPSSVSFSITISNDAASFNYLDTVYLNAHIFG